MRLSELEGMGITLGSQFVDDGTAGIRQAHDLGALVKGLARGIVDGLSQHFHVTRRVHLDDLAVAATDEQAQVGELGDLGIGCLLDEM